MNFTAGLTNCDCCPRKCGVNRLAGQTGICRVGAGIALSHAGLHFGEEPPISGTKGSGTLFFAGCNLRCVFCQNYQISQEFQQARIRTLTPEALASEMLRLQEKGAHNINFVSPSHMVYQMADAIILARGKGLAVPVVYNSGGYDSVDALRQIRGLVDIYLPDLKYMENRLGKQYSGADDYADIAPRVIEEMLSQAGHLETDENGIALRGLLVRHLVLPGSLTSSRSCLRFLAGLSRNISISLMSQYSVQYKACDYPGLNRNLTKNEYDEIVNEALDLGLENVFIQEIESPDHWLPDFSKENPFSL